LNTRRNTLVKLDFRNWVEILRFSYVWGITEVIKVAGEEMDGFDSPADLNIDVGREYGIKRLLREGYLHLVGHADPISEGALQRLGLKTVIKIYRARELRYREVAQFAYIDAKPEENIETESSNFYSALAGVPPKADKYLSNIVPASPAPSDPVKRILAARGHSLSDILRAACEDLVKRREPLTPGEGQLLGEQMVMQILPARLCIIETRFQDLVDRSTRNNSMKHRSFFARRGVRLEDVESVVDEVFAEEFSLCRF
jgi:hypothetical protein